MLTNRVFGCKHISPYSVVWLEMGNLSLSFILFHQNQTKKTKFNSHFQAENVLH